MALLEIQKAGSPVLKQVCKPIHKVDTKLKKLLDDMAETMYDASGVGLAAPQVGIPIRAVVIDVGNGLLELINPVIVASEGCETGTEGCLSIPGMYGDVERFTSVTVQGLDRQGEPITVQGSGLLARALQHEIDHLEGVLFIERAQSVFRERKE